MSEANQSLVVAKLALPVVGLVSDPNKKGIWPMGLLTIRKYGDPILRETCQPLNEVTDAVRNLIDDMGKTMREHKGVGLAACQVGVNERIVVISGCKELLSLVNPEILHSEGKEIAEEGCLSVPDIQVDVERAAKIVVEGLDREGKRVKLTLDGLVARAMQHEVDHLNGVLITDYLSFVRRQLIRKQLQGIARIKREGKSCLQRFCKKT